MRRIGNQSPAVAIHPEVEFFKHSLPDDDFIAQHQRFIECTASLNDYVYRFSHPNDVFAPVSVFSETLAGDGKPQRLNDVRRHNHPHRTCIHQRISLVTTHLIGRELSAPLAWFPRLSDATAEQRRKWRLIGRGHGIHWPEVDEDISIASLLRAA